MTNQEILFIAMAQSAIDCNCNTDDFVKTEKVIVSSGKAEYFLSDIDKLKENVVNYI